VRWQDIEYRPPCLYLLHSRVAPAGVLPRPDGSEPDGFHVEVVYAITPATETSTYPILLADQAYTAVPVDRA
jgi:vanillate O-demethylase monooxygenase subunit